MGSFTKLPNALLLDPGISLGARLAYALLNHLLWEVGGKPDEEVEMPTVAELARRLGCSSTAFKGYLAELRESGWVATSRATNQRLAYTVRIARADTEAEPDSVPAPAKAEPDSGSELGRIPPLARVKTADQDNARGEPPPPPLAHVDGRNVALDALLSACRIDERSPRVREAVVALQGRGRETGIRELFWVELLRIARTRGVPDEALAERAAEDPTAFPLALAEAIPQKAAEFRQKKPHMNDLTPGLLRRHWLDLEHVPSRAGMTPAEIAAYGGGR